MAMQTVLVVFSLLIPVCVGLEWTSADIPNGTTLFRCKGDNVSFPWSFSTSPGDTVLTVNWFFSNGNTETPLATYMLGHFFPVPGYKRTLEYLSDAGIKLYNVTLSDMGLYSVQINLNQAGVVATSVQSASLSLPDAPVLSEGRLSAAMLPGTMYDDVTHQWHVQLSCGHFAKLGDPPASVLWRTPQSEVLESSFYNHGSFILVLQNPVQGGPYTCFLNTSSPTLGCTEGFPNIQAASGHITVDAVESRLLVLESENRHVQAQLKAKDKLVADLTSQLEQQKERVGDMTSELEQQKELVGDMTSELEQQKELVANLTSESEQQVRLVARLTSELEQQKELVADLTSETGQQARLVANVTSELEQQKELVADLTFEAEQQKNRDEEHEDQIANLTAGFWKHEEVVSNLTTEFAQHADVIFGMVSDLGQQTELVANLTSEVELQKRFILNLVPTSCVQEIDAKKINQSGLIRTRIGSKLIAVLCDDGWTVIQRRFDGSENFYRGWDEYEQGFASVSGEFWLGLYPIYQLTRSQNHTLHILMEDKDGKTAFAQYKEFSISAPSDNYRLHVSGYSGTAGDSLTYHNNQQFSTYDRDHDTNGGNCASKRQGAWWYNSCDLSSLNGPYRTPGRSGPDGIIWDTFGLGRSLKSVVMKIRPQ